MVDEVKGVSAVPGGTGGAESPQKPAPAGKPKVDIIFDINGRRIDDGVDSLGREYYINYYDNGEQLMERLNRHTGERELLMRDKYGRTQTRQVFDHTGKQTRFEEYDTENGKLVQCEKFEYDETDRLQSMRTYKDDKLVSTETFEYDKYGKLVKSSIEKF